MKRIFYSVLLVCMAHSSSFAQYFFDDFESYTVNNYVAPQSNQWTTWSAAFGGSEGGADDVYVANSAASSGSQSLYFYSASGNGPHDLVLDFGGVHSTGRFKYTAKYYIPSGRSSYFNFQGGSGIGQTWAMDFYFYSGGNFSITGGGGLSGTFPHDRWFELVIDANLDTDTWQVLIDGVSKGTFTNSNSISYLDLYEVSSNSEWWIDDVSFCINKSCNPELELTNLQITPGSVCTHHPADISLSVKNNSSFTAASMVLGLNVGGVVSSYPITNLNLAAGQTKTVNLTGVVVPQTAGANILVAAINLQGDINATNDTAKKTMTVLPSPTNTKINKGTPYQSTRMMSEGSMLDPDIVTAGHVLTYEVVPPTGYNNSGYGTTWNITGLAFVTSNGTSVSNALYSFSAPTGSNNAKITFSPTAQWVDSSIRYSFAVNSLANTCDSVLNRYINVVPVPNAQFTQADVCDKQQMTFTNGSTIQSGSMSFLWSFGDGNTSNLQNPTHLYASHGAYTVKLVVTSNYGYMDSTDVVVNVNQLPTADFDVNNACQGTSLTFIDQSIIPTGTPSYDWDYGDGSTHGTGQTSSHLYATPGTYSVTMVITINGCSDTKTKYGTQAPRAVLGYTSQVACNNTTAKFLNSSTLAFGTFGTTWRFGDGSVGTSYNASHKYSGFGNFDVTMIITTDLGCVDSLKQTITTKESPNADFALSNACSDELITVNNLTNTPTGGSNFYTWDLGNGFTSSNTSPVTQYPGPGVYFVKLVAVNGNGCADSTTKTIVIDTKPIADFHGNNACLGEESEFTNNTINLPDGGTYAWDFGNGTLSSNQDVTLTYGAVGQYQVSLIVSTANGCKDTASKTVNVFAIPDASFVASSGQTGDGTMVFSANAGSGHSYLWFVGDGTKYTTKDVIHSYLQSGNYEVRLVVTSTNGGCKSDESETVSVTPTSVNTAAENIFTVYPNPNSGMFTIQVASEIENGQVEVFNAQGQSIQVISSGKLHSGSMQIDLGHVASGVYFVRLSSNGQSWNQKIHIQ